MNPGVRTEGTESRFCWCAGRRHGRTNGTGVHALLKTAHPGDASGIEHGKEAREERTPVRIWPETSLVSQYRTGGSRGKSILLVGCLTSQPPDLRIQVVAQLADQSVNVNACHPEREFREGVRFGGTRKAMSRTKGRKLHGVAAVPKVVGGSNNMHRVMDIWYIRTSAGFESMNILSKRSRQDGVVKANPTEMKKRGCSEAEKTTTSDDGEWSVVTVSRKEHDESKSVNPEGCKCSLEEKGLVYTLEEAVLKDVAWWRIGGKWHSATVMMV
ncbi:hypothetical protein DL96DRAFT_1685601 [Flagelloscypha sp. PMI_526]|nr:hypothetical protein DL96DRAFT_1685601 [Flagelloscypha sp. PMI_526]